MTTQHWNPELVAKLEAERAQGLPRWQPTTTAEDQKRLADAQKWMAKKTKGKTHE